MLDGYQSSRAQFLGALVLSEEISSGEYSLGMLGREFLTIGGTFEQLTLYFGKDDHIHERTLPIAYEPYYPEKVKS